METAAAPAPAHAPEEKEHEHDTTEREGVEGDDTPRTQRTQSHSTPQPTDSMVTVPLGEGTDSTVGAGREETEVGDASEAANEDVNDDGKENEEEHVSEPTSPTQRTPDITVDEQRLSSRPTSADILQALVEPRKSQASLGRARGDSSGSEESAHVDWASLDKKEEQEQEHEGQDDEAMALLLARLEQENNALSADPKSRLQSAAERVRGRVNSAHARARSQSRPPSLNQLRRLVQGGGQEQGADVQVRFSQLPSPPPMTELEFWAALVRDYPQTVQRLPTLTLNKIRGGIPAPLRGVVWQSASGARARLVEDQYASLCGESSPYENIINKDLGRSFPGVDMFKDPDGEGQKMLGRVLKCFSLYDRKIGYCQGLGFLVGPLLMQMGDKEAFCVLVRLMEDYDLRACFLPDLSGLHLRIFQFQRLLHQHMPRLAAHLDHLGVESAYLSQWFLSFFAVTCPLPMLFRIYDVLFAEGASETIMRVALALMKRNEHRILALAEFEDVMQLLLGRSLWDPYGRNAKSADDLVSDFVSFTNDVTRDSLHGLELAFRESQKKDDPSKQVHKSATSFLGRLWPISTASTKSVSLSPGLAAPSRPASFLRRTPSKQSLATLNSEQGSDSSAGTQSTAMTEVSRASSGDALSLKSGHQSAALSTHMGHSAQDRDLHYQIEQLLMSISQLQRQNSEIEAALQKQREDRKEDHRIVRAVIDKMRNKHSTLSAPSSRESRRRTTITAAMLTPPADADSPATPAPIPSPQLDEAAAALEERFPSHQTHHRVSSMFETKTVLKDSLARTKEQLNSETVRATSLARTLNDTQADLQIARDALKETRHRLQESYNQSQRHEKTIQDLRQSARKASWAASMSGGGADTTPDSSPSLSRSSTADSTKSSGLRELRLGRSGSQREPPPMPQFTKRSSSLATHSVLSQTQNNTPADNEALLLELVNAKTSEAVAKQEVEEMRARYEALRKAVSAGGSVDLSKDVSPQSTPPALSAASVVNVLWGKREAATPPPASADSTPKATPPASTATTAGTGWGWGWKRSASTNNASVT